MALKAQLLTDTIITTDGKFIYALDSFNKVEEVWWKENYTVWPVKYVELTEFESIFQLPVSEESYGEDEESTPATQKPSHYNWNNGYLKLFPVPYVPDYGDTIIVVGYSKVTNIESDTAFIDNIPVIYRPVVEAYATYSVAIQLGQVGMEKSYAEKFKLLMSLIENKVDIKQ